MVTKWHGPILLLRCGTIISSVRIQIISPCNYQRNTSCACSSGQCGSRSLEYARILSFLPFRASLARDKRYCLGGHGPREECRRLRVGAASALRLKIFLRAFLRRMARLWRKTPCMRRALTPIDSGERVVCQPEMMMAEVIIYRCTEPTPCTRTTQLIVSSPRFPHSAAELVEFFPLP